MTLLALETSTAWSSAAVVDAAGRVLGASRPADGPRQTRRLLEGVHEALTQAGLTMTDLDTVVCGLGPGTFTGLRIGVATARALAQSAGLEVGGVPTLAALARGLAAGEPGASAETFVPLIDGRRNEVFAAVYERVADEPRAVDAAAGVAPTADASWPRLREVVPLTIVPAADLAAFLSSWPGAVTGGDGAVLYAGRLPAAVVHDVAVAAPTALMVARTWLAGAAGLRRGFVDTLPLYGRRPDAKPAAQGPLAAPSPSPAPDEGRPSAGPATPPGMHP